MHTTGEHTIAPVHSKVGALIALLFWVLAGILPTAGLFSEFSGAFCVLRDDCAAWSIASLYSHVYIFPVLFGWAIVLLVYPPALFVFSQFSAHRTTIFIVSVLIVTAMSSIVLISQAFLENVAVWEISPQYVGQDATGSETRIDDLIQHIQAMQEATNEQDTDGGAAGMSATRIGAKTFEGHLLSAHRDRENWSTTKYFVLVSTFLQTYAYLWLIFMTMLLPWISSAALRFNRNIPKPVVMYLLISLLLLGIWYLMALGFIEKEKLLVSRNELPIDGPAITVVYLMGLMYWVGILFKQEAEKIMAAVGAIAAVLFGILTYFDNHVAPFLNSPNVGNYLILSGVVVFLVAPAGIVSVFRAAREGEARRPH